MEYGMKYKIITASIWALGLFSTDLRATAYTNEAPFNGRPAPVGYRAIDTLVNSGAAVFVASGKKFSTSPDGANGTLAGDAFFADTPFFYTDCARGITAQHRALGFIDLLVTVFMDDAPGVSVSGPGVAPYTNGWRMMGDSDRRDSQDIRVVADGSLFEFLDTRYKSQYSYNVSYDNGVLAIMTFPPRNSSRTYYSGEYAVLRMEVPRYPVKQYSVYVGPNVLRPYPAGLGYTTPTGDYNDGRALAYQGHIFTPILSNKIIPVIDIKSPSADGVFVQRYDDNANVLRPPVRTYYVPARVPIVFSGENSYRSNVNIVSWEWQAETPGVWTPGRETYTAVFQTNGNYLVKLRIMSDAGDVAANDGSSNDSGNFNRPDFKPGALPFVVTVTEPPAIAAMQEPRPNPFILGQNARVVFDFTLKEDMPVSIAIYAVDGQLMKNILTSQGKYPAGYWSAFWNGKDERGNFVAEGIYYGVMSTPNGKYLSKVHVLRVQ